MFSFLSSKPLVLSLLSFMVLTTGLSSVLTSSSGTNTQSIYEVLRSHGLPLGLLPNRVTEFEVSADGRFLVQLDQACNAKFESELHYDRNVSGTLSYGQIGELSGISAQELFLWFPVKGIHVDVPSSGVIYFDVDVVQKQLPLSLFETPPDCVAVRSEEIADFHVGKLMADTLSKSLSERQDHLDREYLARDVL